MNVLFDKEKFHDELKNMEIYPNDTVLINLNISKFGLFKGFKKSDYVQIFKEYFSQDGTFMALSFTYAKMSLRNRNLPYFDGTQLSNTGAFSNAMLKDADSVRSLHPTNSVVAIGKYAKELTEGIDDTAGAYEFVERLVERKGKVLLIGMGEYPGFITHGVEARLGLYKQYWNRFFIKVKLDKKIFTRLDPGGCSSTFGMLYPEYIKNEILVVNRINGAYSLSIRADLAYEIDLNYLRKNPNALICDNSDCLKCRLFRWKTIWKLPFFIWKYLFKKLQTK
jgi:aminoglycoside N3'-acetyltransferase